MMSGDKNLSPASRHLRQFAVVDIDASGTFKYVLIQVTLTDCLKSPEAEGGNEISKVVVRGNAAASYHADIYDVFEEQVNSAARTMKADEAECLQLECQCLGGGRIMHDPDAKRLKVYGYSVGFGRADHSKTVELLKLQYSDYTIDWSDEGY